MGRFTNFLGGVWNTVKNVGRKVGGFLGKVVPVVKTVSGVLSHVPVIGPIAGLVNKGATMVEKVMDVIKPKQQSKDPPKQNVPALMAPKKQPRIIEPDDDYYPATTSSTNSIIQSPSAPLPNKFNGILPSGPIYNYLKNYINNRGTI